MLGRATIRIIPIDLHFGSEEIYRFVEEKLRVEQRIQEFERLHGEGAVKGTTKKPTEVRSIQEDFGVDVYTAKGAPWKPNPEKGTPTYTVPNDTPEKGGKGGKGLNRMGRSFSPHLGKGKGKSETTGENGTVRDAGNTWRGRSRDTTDETYRGEGCHSTQEKKDLSNTTDDASRNEGCWTCMDLGLPYTHNYWECEKRLQRKKGKGGWGKGKSSVGETRPRWRSTTPEGSKKQ